LGVDPLAVDGWGNPAAVYSESPGIDRRIMERIRELTRAELDSADRGHRRVNAGMMDLLAAVSLHDWETAERLLRDAPDLLKSSGTLHIAAKRGDAVAVKWLLDHGADANARWAHWDADVTPLHLAALADHADVARVLLDGGADPSIHDSKHDSDALGWAEFFGRVDMVRLLREAGSGKRDAGSAKI
jgi:ankyrin repeat protein